MNDATPRPSTIDSEPRNADPAVVNALIVNQRGLHARAAAKFVKLADAFEADIQVTKDGQTVSGLSIMGLMMLAAGPGSTVELSASGPQGAEALAALEKLIRNKFDED